MPKDDFDQPSIDLIASISTVYLKYFSLRGWYFLVFRQWVSQKIHIVGVEANDSIIKNWCINNKLILDTKKTRQLHFCWKSLVDPPEFFRSNSLPKSIHMMKNVSTLFSKCFCEGVSCVLPFLMPSCILNLGYPYNSNRLFVLQLQTLSGSSYWRIYTNNNTLQSIQKLN